MALRSAIGPAFTYQGGVTAGLAFITMLALGDVWAIGANRLYPLGLRRQTRAPLAFKGKHSEASVRFLWGFDAGLGVTTYRVTSGVWVLGLMIVFGLAEAWAVMLYSAGFASGLLAFIFWPVSQRRSLLLNSEVFTSRLAHVSRYRRVGQTLYALCLFVAIVSLLLGS